jgi:hypothetical protein
VATNNKNSQFDPGLIVKDVHDFHGQSIRVSDTRSVISSYYTHFRAEYNEENQPIEVSYFRGSEPHKTTLGCVSDLSGSLQNTYIKLYSAPDNKPFHIWFNVDSLGTDPAPENSTPIEIQINSNDPSSVIAMAVALTLNTLFKDDFTASRMNSVVDIKTTGLGLVTSSSNFGTDFTITNSNGAQELVGFIEIGYENLHPIYKGQTLKNYRFNLFTGQFEHKEEATIPLNEVLWDEIATTFPSDVSELYSYKYDSQAVQDVLVTYADPTKKIIVSVQKTRY